MTLTIALHACPLERMNPKKETTLLLGAEASIRYEKVYYYTADDLFLEDNTAYAWARKIKVDSGDSNDLHFIGETEKLKLNDCDVILMRQNPPINQNYLTNTYILDYVDSNTLILNNPHSIRSINGKIFANDFKDYVVPYSIGNDINTLLSFYKEHSDIILKPIDGFGGDSIYRITNNCDPIEVFEKYRKNTQSIFIVQQYIPEAVKGDKRIIIFDGEPVAALMRVPAEPDKPANITLGATIEETEITENEYNLCREMAPILRESGLFFVGIDMLGDYLSEVNLISPGTIRPANNLYGIELEKTFWDKVEQRLENKKVARAV